jgi:hypothetical protein
VSSRASGGVLGNCSCIALAFRSRLTSTSPIHGLVPPASMRSSCKRRGWCPSCASRRRAESGAHLVDNVLPKAPVSPVGAVVPVAATLGCSRRKGQWLSRVLGVVIRALSRALLKRAGVRHRDGARSTRMCASGQCTRASGHRGTPQGSEQSRRRR